MLEHPYLPGRPQRILHVLMCMALVSVCLAARAAGDSGCCEAAPSAQDQDVPIFGNPFRQQQRCHPVQVGKAGHEARSPLGIAGSGVPARKG